MTGNRLVTVDVQEGLRHEEAMAAAVDSATRAACLAAADDPCATVTLPPLLGAEPGLITADIRSAGLSSALEPGSHAVGSPAAPSLTNDWAT